MNGADMDAAAFPVGAAVETVDDVRSGRADGPLYRVVGVQGALRDVRRVETATGVLDGIEMRFLAAELRPVRASVMRRYEALRARRVLAQYRQAAATDADDFAIVEELLDSAQSWAALVLDGPNDDDGAVATSGFVSDIDGAHVVQIDTTEATGRVRVFINDGTVYDGDPETDEPPGAHYRGAGWEDGRRLWNVRSLMTGETSAFRATGQADATAQYLEVVASNLLVWAEPEQTADRCDECGAATAELESPRHGPTCSLNPANVIEEATG